MRARTVLSDALVALVIFATGAAPRSIEGEWIFSRAALEDGAFQGEGTSLAISAPEAPSFIGEAAIEFPADGPLLTIDRGLEHLLARQHRDGSWAPHGDGYRNGQTALNAHALVASGVGKGSAPILAALDYLSRGEPSKTYSAGFMLAFLGALGDAEHAAWAEQIIELLVEWESDSEPGSWGYPGGRPDISNAQITALGLWGAARLGVQAPDDVWQRMAKAAIERHQTIVENVDWTGEHAGRRSGRKKIAGFTYYAYGDVYPASGSMATAGLCILVLAKDQVDKELGRKLLREIERSERLCFDWLEHRWSVERNPGYVRDEGHLYYLYGLERVGAFYSIDTIGGHEWYREGAEYLVRSQSEDGGWGREDETSFALLFLNRATSHVASRSRTRAARDVVVSADAPVRVRCTGDMLQVFALDSVAIETDGRARVRIARVTWSIDGEIVSRVDGDEHNAWGGEPYALRCRAPGPGSYVVECSVDTLMPGASVSGKPGRATMTSVPLTLELDWTPESWVEAAWQNNGRSLLADSRVDVSVSSQSETAANVCDGREATRWLADATDGEPWVRLDPARPVRAEFVTLGHAGSSFASRASHASATEVEVSVNGKDPVRHGIDGGEPGTIVLSLGGRVTVRRLEIRVVGRSRTDARLGFSEIGLR